MLSKTRINKAAKILVDARLRNSVIDEIPEPYRPICLEDAYAIQDRFIALLGMKACGWFGACTNSVIQQLLGLDEPYYAHLLCDHVYKAPAVLDRDNYPPMAVECEFGFEVKRDFVPSHSSYSRQEIEDAVIRVFPTIEVVAPHLEDFPSQGIYSIIADNGTDGALITGNGFLDWRSLDLINTKVSLYVDGIVKKEGLGRNILGDPMNAFVWLVNAVTRDNKTVCRGDIHNTGTATDIHWLGIEDKDIFVDFGNLGSVQMNLM